MIRVRASAPFQEESRGQRTLNVLVGAQMMALRHLQFLACAAEAKTIPMCVFATLYSVRPDVPLLVLFNREESRSRRTDGPRLRKSADHPVSWLGGADLQAGGTWLGLNEFGLIVLVTNRSKQLMGGELRSRGLLCRDLLQSASVDDVNDEFAQQFQRHEFAGMNIAMLSRDKCLVIEAGDCIQSHSLEPGIHCITNADLNDPTDDRIRRVQQEFEFASRATKNLDTLLASVRRICALPTEKNAPAICTTQGEWGTVSSTIIALGAGRTDVRYEYVDGPPATTEYVDYSSLAKQLLTSDLKPERPEPE